MKTSIFKKYIHFYQVSIFLLVLLSSANLTAQTEPTVTDTVKKGVDLGKLKIKNPPTIVEAYTYDPISNRYIYTSKVNDFNISYPIILTPKEYDALVRKEAMRTYFRKKNDAMDGKKEGAEEAKKDLLPRYYINSGLFESIFGGNTIDIKPTGSVEMDLGLRYSKQDNPALSPQNRSSTTFDFNQRISMSLRGKVGTRLNVNANYDTQSTFAFQNLIKLDFSPTEDDIIQKVEVGNVSMPLNTSLIRGAQSLFGVKAQLQFGKTTFTGVFSEQKSQTKTVTAQGGATVQDFQMFALEYDSDRHFFLSQYFRNKYDSSLRNYPFIDSRAQITRVEVWITNKQNRVNSTNNNLRNIVALQDLGEAQLTGFTDNQIVVTSPSTDFFIAPIDTPADNSNNKYDPLLIDKGGFLNKAIREIPTLTSGFNGITVSEGLDYSKLENARKLTTSEFTFHPQLGYISLQQKLANDEVLAVAFQYTIGEKVYQVGEFGTDGVEATQTSDIDPTTGQPKTVSSQCLILKMLKSNLTSIENPITKVTTPIWNLMMKNIYQIPGGYQLQGDDFKFNILYTDPSPLNYITQASPTATLPVGVAETPLLKVFNVDKLNYNNDPQAGGDGFFDFIPGLTVDTQNGRLIFTTVEPFGKHLFEKLRTSPTENYDDTTVYNPNQTKYVFRNLYHKTQSAALQDSDKNKFQLKGKFKSAGGDGIPIGAFNVPKGSVVVKAGGRLLLEGVDYSVNYQLGRVQILDPSLQASNTPIEVSVENNSVFGQQTRRFMGVNVEHKFNEKFLVGATFLKLSEKPFTQKSNYGQESVNNTIYGFNTNYATEVPFITRMVNKLPFVDTDVPSNVSVRGEVAFLKPDTPQGDRFGGESTVYVDDFEGSQSSIDMRSPASWYLSSVPSKSNTSIYDFNAEANDLSYGYKRAKISWYTIDPTFYASRPAGTTIEDISYNSTRRVYSEELYPVTDIAIGQTQVVSTLDLSYYPKERGPYNFNPVAATNNQLPNPTENFGGIMRSVSATNFEQSNVEYIQFWMMDPYFDEGNPTQEAAVTNTGKIYFNLGSISEDILKDGRKQFENGLGDGQILVNPQPLWGNIPASQSLIYAFDTNPDARIKQDVGLDGMTNEQEAVKFPSFASNEDPSGDDYQYYIAASGTIQERYRKYNGTQGNSPIEVTDTNRGSTTMPDVEDINRDNTMNTINAYYEYSIDVHKGMQIGVDRYVTDIRETIATNLPAGANPTKARWIQFKIPVSAPENTIGGISDFRSISYMRMFMTGFTDKITVRFGSLDLVRGEWRRFNASLDKNDPTVTDDGTGFDVISVNVQENGDRKPIRYITPPGVYREQLYNNNTVINQNEQSLALRANNSGLEPNDARAVFKNVSVDMRQYNSIKMFLHAEALPSTLSTSLPTLKDDQMVAFIRLGNDFSENFYQIEVPLKITKEGATIAEEVWPELNNIDLSLSLLTQLKVMSIGSNPPPADENGIRFVNDDVLDPSLSGNTSRGKLRLGVKGNPNFGMIRTLMVGVKNKTTNQNIGGEVWFNELRMAGMDNSGGMAAVMSLDSNFADLATVSASGKRSTIGFGALEQKPQERSREDVKQYNWVSNLNIGKLMPKKWGINLPFNYAIGEEIITPQYDPFNQDIKLQQLIDVTTNPDEKYNLNDRAISYTKRKSINFIGVKKERGPEQKQHIYDPENVTLSYSYNKVDRHDYQIESFVDQEVNVAADYTYNFKAKPVEVFKWAKFMKKNDYWRLLSDFNFNFLPSNISFSSNVNRQYNRQQFRQVEVAGIGLDPLYRRNFLFNYKYGVNYNLTKSLKLNYTASSNNVVRNYLNADNIPDNNVGLWDDFWNIGSSNQYSQQLTANYELPINKIPIFSFIKSTYTYTGNFSWQRPSIALTSIEGTDGTTYNLGNTVQNSGSHKLNTVFNMESFYKYVGLAKKPKKTQKVEPVAAPKPGEKVVKAPVVQEKQANIFVEGIRSVVTGVKNIQINYTDNRGTSLPGFTEGIGFWGTTKPSIGFIFGSQDDVRYESAKRGWLTTYPDFNQNFTQVSTNTLNATANMDLFPDFKIDLTAERSKSDNFSEQYDVRDGVYNSRSPYNTGNYSISTILIGTAFSTSDANTSSAFQAFRDNRFTIANRLATQRGIDITNPVNLDTEGYPLGYGKNNQAVLIPSFLSAYMGSDASSVSTSPFRNIPLPNWVAKYSGLMRYDFFKESFKRFSVQHSYKSSYTINSYRSNLEYNNLVANPTQRDQSGNFINENIIANINLVEQFSPLFRLDFELKNSMKFLVEMKKDRALSLSFDNNLLTEVKGHEYVIGMGYRVKDVRINSRLADNAMGVIKSDINIKADFSYRKNQTIVRYLDYDNNKISGGQDIWTLKLTADYSFSKNLTTIFFYDHSFANAVISTTYPMTNIRTGFTLRYNFGN